MLGLINIKMGFRIIKKYRQLFLILNHPFDDDDDYYYYIVMHLYDIVVNG